MKKAIYLIVFLLNVVIAHGQGSAFGVKGGLSLGTQKWNNLDQNVLFAWHGDIYVESLSEENSFSLIAQL